MRMRETWQDADDMAQSVDEAVADSGSMVKIIITPATGGASETSRVDRCIVQPLAPDDVNRMRQEGVLNVNDSRPTAFVFGGNGYVVEATNLIVWDGWAYRIVGVTPEWLGDTRLSITAVGVRSKQV